MRHGIIASLGDLTGSDTIKLNIDEVRARDGDGLKLYDDGGNGIFVEDGGQIGIGTINPDELLHLKSSLANKPILKIENTNADGAGAEIEFFKISASPADDDILGDIRFYGKDSAGNATLYSFIRSYSSDITDTDEGGRVAVEVVMNATNRNLLDIKGYNGVVNQGEVTINKAGQDVDFRIESNVSTDAFFVEGSSGNVGMGITTPLNTLHVVGDIRVTSDITDGTNAITVAEICDPKYIVGDTSALGGLDNEVLSKTINTQNLLLNGNFEYWYSGTSSAPDGWVLAAGGSVAREGTIVRIDLYSMKLTSDSDGNFIYQDIDAHERGLEYWKGRTLTFSCWVYASDASTARIQLHEGGNWAYSSYHTGGSAWELLTVTMTMSGSSTDIKCYCRNDGNTKVVYFDGAIVVEGSAPFAFAPHSEDHLYEQTIIGVDALEVIDNTIATRNGIYNSIAYYSYPESINSYMLFPISIPADVCGKTVIIDECTLYFYTDISGDYIAQVQIFQTDGDGTVTNSLEHAAIANGTSGNESHQIVDTPLELADKPTFLNIKIAGTDANTDVRFYSAVIKYHIKVHE